jgi:50S ribosomal protein L16 3-hydroxylase
MFLQKLLGDVSKQQFSAEYLHRLPLAQPGTAAEFIPWASWELLGRLLEHHADAMVVRQGARWTGEVPANLQEARQLCDEGWTILVRHAEQHDPQLKKIADSFHADFHAPVNIHLYVTPAGTHGFSWHYDAEDVFIVQTAGRKEYSLRKNTVNPWPLVETIPADMRYERELMPMMRVELRAGDWLYIPCGYWHKADALPDDDAAISLAIGIMSPAAIDLLEFLRPRLLSSLLWRQRLPTLGDASPDGGKDVDRQFQEVCAMLADDLATNLRNEHLPQQFLEWQRQRSAASPGNHADTGQHC